MRTRIDVIYLDNNATTAIDPDALLAMQDIWQRGPLNPSSQHAAGRIARNLLDRAVSQLGGLLGADVDSPGGDRLVLTSGGTEANNLAISGIGDPAGPLVISAIEHPSVLEAARHQAAGGRTVRVIPVTHEGVIDLSLAEQVIGDTDQRPALVSVMSANNETGVIQPTQALAAICRQAAVPLHVDATQSIGTQPVSLDTWGADALTISAHKFHGPVGVGLLLVRRGVPLRPALFGGEQQLSARPGTEPVALAIGMAHALRLAVDRRAADHDALSMLRDRFETNLLAACPDGVVHGQGSLRIAGTSCLSLPAVDRQALLMALDFAGVACSSGSACASGSSRPSHVLQAMGLEPRLIDSALRFGFSRLSTIDEQQAAVDIISRQYRRLSDLLGVDKID